MRVILPESPEHPHRPYLPIPDLSDTQHLASCTASVPSSILLMARGRIFEENPGQRDATTVCNLHGK